MSGARESIEPPQLRMPHTPAEWDRYYELRWRVLRAPWNQPRGSERDDLEEMSVHTALWDANDVPVAVGRLHLNSAREAQVRFMAVEPGHERLGLGSRILRELEARAGALGATEIVLNAREEAQPFYRRHGYESIGPASTLFGSIPHEKMRKVLAAAV